MQQGFRESLTKTSKQIKVVPQKRPLQGDLVTIESSSSSKNVYAMFTRPKKQPRAESSSRAKFQWIQPAPFLAKMRTASCLYGVNMDPAARTKIAAFDLDGTVIKSSFAKKSTNGVGPNFEWWNKCVQPKLKELHDDGYALVFISNQNLGEARVKAWKTKISAIAEALSDVPFRILAATEKDIFRKPMPGMWCALESLYKDTDISIDMSESFYVGDAAGRSGDHAGSDRKFAQNVGLKFYTPEEYFLGFKPSAYTLKGFDIRTVSFEGPTVFPSSTPLLMEKKQPPIPEIVLFIGYPSSGKTSFFKRHFEPAGYQHIDETALKMRVKYLKAVESSIKSGVSCVVESTYSTLRHRKLYIDLASSLSVPIRSIVFQASLELAYHNNLYRAFCKPLLSARNGCEYDAWELGNHVPYSQYTTYKNSYEDVTVKEGFSEIKKVNWRFDGSDDEKKFWNMCLQVEGK